MGLYGGTSRARRLAGRKVWWSFIAKTPQGSKLHCSKPPPPPIFICDHCTDWSTWLTKVQTAPPEVHPVTTPLQTARLVMGLLKVITIVQELVEAGTLKLSSPTCPVDQVDVNLAMVSQVAPEDVPTATVARTTTTATTIMLTTRCSTTKCWSANTSMLPFICLGSSVEKLAR